MVLFTKKHKKNEIRLYDKLTTIIDTVVTYSIEAYSSTTT